MTTRAVGAEIRAERWANLYAVLLLAPLGLCVASLLVLDADDPFTAARVGMIVLTAFGVVLMQAVRWLTVRARASGRPAAPTGFIPPLR